MMKFKPTILGAMIYAVFPAWAGETGTTESERPTEYYRITEKGTFRLYRIESPAVIEVIAPKKSADPVRVASSEEAAPVAHGVAQLDSDVVVLPSGPSEQESKGFGADVGDFFLDVVLNEVPTNLLVHFKRTSDGDWSLTEEDRQAIGLLPVAAASMADDWVALNKLPGVSTRYEEATQRLHIRAENHALVTRIFDIQEEQRKWRTSHHQDLPVESNQDFGAFINHTLYYSTGGERWSGLTQRQYASGLFEGNFYGAFGTLTSSQLLKLNRVTPDRGTRRFQSVRLDTQWSWYDEERLLTISAGDFVGSSLSWSRATRMGGLQLRRNFSIRPDLVTMPVLSDMSGSAAVPSTVELYVNNTRRFSQEVAPGPFSITNLPMITGSGAARMVVRDALGRETISETPFYASSKLLAPGLADFAAELGFARRNYGTLSHDYDTRLLGSVNGRYGLNNAITLEGVAQGGGRLALLGLGSVIRVGTFGVVGLSGAVSRYGIDGGKETGTQLTASVETRLAGFSINARHQRTMGDYNDLSSISVARPKHWGSFARLYARSPRSMSQVSVSLPTYAADGWSTPSVNFSYTPITQADRSRSRLFGVNVGQRLPWDGWLSVSAYRDMERKNSGMVFAMFSWFLGDRISTSSSYSKLQGGKASTSIDMARSEQSQFNSLGWRLRSSQGMSKSQAASASYRTRIGRFEAGVEHMQMGKHVNGRLQMDGAMVFAGGGAFLTNRVYNSFGVVNVGAPDVEVRYENNPVGKTDSSGRILLTGLRAYERNLVTIDPMTLPVDANIPILKRAVRPSWRSGVVVDFNVDLQARSALVTLRDEADAVLPVGSEVILNATVEAVVGYDGQVWLEGIEEVNRLVVKQTNKPDCVFEFTAPKKMQERLEVPDGICKG